MPSETELLLRLLLACLLGGAVGLERELSGQGAGFRTHILVALGSCLFTLVSAYAFTEFLRPSVVHTTFDPSRIAAQIVTGVGFLGGGAILRSGTGVRGLTTAASLWVVAAVGMAAGAGFYGPAGLSTGLSLAALWGLRRVRRRLIAELRGVDMELVVEAGPETGVQDILRALEQHAVRIQHVRIEPEGESRTVSLTLRLPPEARPEDMVGTIGTLPGLRRVEWSR